MKVARGRNCYNCGRFEHLVRYCRNWRIVVERRKIKIVENEHLKEEGD